MKKWLGALAGSFLLFAAGFNLHSYVRNAEAGVSCSVPFNLTNGTIADASQVMANYNALIACLSNAAAAGANTDITALLGLTTPLSPTEGGSTVFIGATPTASGNTVVIATTTPGAFAYTTGYTVAFIAQAANVATATIDVNAQGVVNLYKQSQAGATPLTGGELQTGQVVLATYDGTEFQINPVPNVTPGFGLSNNASGTAIQINTNQPPYGFDQPVNLGLTAIASGNLLQVNITQANGQAPAATSSGAVLIPFRNTTLATGRPNWVAVIATTLIDTNAAGATLGTTNNIPFRFWIVAFNNNGVVVPALINCSTVTATNSSIFQLDESSEPNTTAVSNAAKSAGVFYTENGTALTGMPFRILGYLEYSSGVSTAGTYTLGPTKIQLFGPGIKKPGDIVQGPFYATQTATGTTTNTYNFPISGSPAPGIANGATAATVTITPSSPVNILEFEGSAYIECNAASERTLSFLYNGATTLAAGYSHSNGTAVPTWPARFVYQAQAGSTNTTTYTLLYGAEATSFLNGASNAADVYFGITNSTFLRIYEKQG